MKTNEELRQQIRSDYAGIANVEFRLGEIEHLPVADNSVDVITSLDIQAQKPYNCGPNCC
ncbi:MAG: methyltransferase domain-containing protein [Phycisphaerales bacterium]|nr:methyltransferase domain-containing protein [Phycisphaerales bacterium]